MFEDYMERYKEWFTSGYVEEDNILEELEDIRGDEQEIKDRFCETLDFGTAGLRGIMKAGLNGMNVYTVRLATQEKIRAQALPSPSTPGSTARCSPARRPWCLRLTGSMSIYLMS